MNTIDIAQVPTVVVGEEVYLGGAIGYTADAKNSQYGWSQFLVLEDGHASVGVWLNLGGPEFAYTKSHKGTNISVTGRVKQYRDKDNKIAYSISGAKLVGAASQTATPLAETPQQQMQQVENQIGAISPTQNITTNDRLTTRRCCFMQAVEMVTADKLGKNDMETFCAEWEQKILYDGFKRDAFDAHVDRAGQQSAEIPPYEPKY